MKVVQLKTNWHGDRGHVSIDLDEVSLAEFSALLADFEDVLLTPLEDDGWAKPPLEVKGRVEVQWPDPAPPPVNPFDLEGLEPWEPPPRAQEPDGWTPGIAHVPNPAATLVSGRYDDDE